MQLFYAADGDRRELPYYDARELQSCSNLFPNMPTNHIDTEMQNISSKATH